MSGTAALGRNRINLKLSEIDALRATLGYANIDNAKIGNSLELPHVDFSVTIPVPIPGLMVYDDDSKEVYAGNGSSWISLSAGGIGNNVESYSFIKTSDLIVNPGVGLTINNWSIGGSSSYHSIPNWNLSTGVYKATANNTYLSIGLTLSWKGGISNLGKRSVKIRWYDASSATVSIVKESMTQADPNAAVATTQEVSFNVKLDMDDEVLIEVEHTSPVNLVVEGGVATHISGLEIT